MLLVFDIGATHTRLGLASGGVLAAAMMFKTDAGRAGFEVFLNAAQAMAYNRRITGVAGGMPGQFEGPKGEFELSMNLPKWNGIPVLAKLKTEFACPVHVLNDVVLGGLGESHYGAGMTKGVMAYFTVSTGINAVRIVDGAIDTTIARYEVGRHVLGDAEGKAVTLESLVGGAAMEKRYGRPPREIRDERVWRGEERHLAYGLYNILLDWSPEVVVFGGSMMRDINLINLGAELRRLPQVLPAWPQLKRSKLGDNVGLYGAMAYLEQLGHKA